MFILLKTRQLKHGICVRIISQMYYGEVRLGKVRKCSARLRRVVDEINL